MKKRMVAEYGSMKAALLAHAAQGLCQGDVAKLYGKTPSAVSKACRDAGVMLPLKEVGDSWLPIAEEASRGFQKATQKNAAILAQTVKILRPGDPGFEEIAKLYTPPVKNEELPYYRGFDELS